MKQATKFAIGTALLVALAAGPVLAHGGTGGKGGERMSFEQLDTDGNGSLTRAEIEARGAARFAALDTDGNGSLSAAEIEAGGSERAKRNAERMIERLDANDDGEVSMEEMQARKGKGGDRAEKRIDRMFEHLDTDENGEITKAEFDAGKGKMRGKR